MRIGAQWFGASEMRNALNARTTETFAKIPVVAFQFMEGVMARSKAEFVPVKTGALRDSGRVEPPQHPQYRNTSVDAVYGGGAVTYALEQHETPWYRHPVGQWKYLEQPLLESAGSAAEVMAAELLWR